MVWEEKKEPAGIYRKIWLNDDTTRRLYDYRTRRIYDYMNIWQGEYMTIDKETMWIYDKENNWLYILYQEERVIWTPTWNFSCEAINELWIYFVHYGFLQWIRAFSCKTQHTKNRSKFEEKINAEKNLFYW